MKLKIHYLFIAFFISLITVGCTNQPTSKVEDKRKVKIVYTDWSEAVAISTLAKILLEEKMDYEVEMKLTNVEDAYREIAEGKYHVFADAWLPETHSQYFNKYGNSIEKLGIVYPGAKTGLVVPEYSQFRSVEDLKNKKMTILGIDTGAGVMHQTRMALKDYNLDEGSLKVLSEKEMTNQFEEAYKRRKEVVITGWEPHWLFARYEVRFLDDPKEVYGHQENIFALGTKGLEEKHPHIVRYFERMQLSERQLNSLIYYMNRGEDPENGIRTWINKNEYIVNQWVKGLKPERKKIY